MTKTAARVAGVVVLAVLAATLPAAAEVGYLDEGTLAAWGRNYYGQCDVPAGLADVTEVAGGAFHSLALKADGSQGRCAANPTHAIGCFTRRP